MVFSPPKENDNKSMKQRMSIFFSRVKLKMNIFVRQKFTVMLIPHSERNILNFQINNIILILLIFIFSGVIAGFFYMASVFATSDRVIDEHQNDLVVTQGNLDSVLDEVGNLVKVYNAFELAMQEVLNSLDISTNSEESPITSGDLRSVSDIFEITNAEGREIFDIRRLSNSFQESIQPLQDIASILEAEQQLLLDLPTLWPVSGGISSVTMEFGPNIHPFEGRWYLHKGIDIAGPVGIPIVASANGRVVESSYNQISGYGNYVLIEHKYGFKTRYSHLSTRLVEVGQTVSQGDRIGTLGNTGLSTGPHLDFQIMLGTEVIDPASFLSIKNTFTRWSGWSGNR